MFKWFYDCQMEADVSIQVAWNFLTNPSNWHKWTSNCDSFALDGEFKKGAQIKAKVKNRSLFFPITVTEMIPYQTYKTFSATLFVSQESLYAFQEITPTKTRITVATYVAALSYPSLNQLCTAQWNQRGINA